MSSADEKPPTKSLEQSTIEKEPTNGGGKNGQRQFFKADGISDRDKNWREKCEDSLKQNLQEAPSKDRSGEATTMFNQGNRQTSTEERGNFFKVDHKSDRERDWHRK